MGKRKGSHGAGTWALPGGHLEFEESFEECARREVLEETGLNVDSLRFLTATNDVMQAERKHYITIFMVCCVANDDAEPQILEPDKCESWEWVVWESMMMWARNQLASNSVSSTASGDEGEQRQLFLPLLSLVQQRPGVVPLVRP